MTWTAGVTQFFDMTQKEFMDYVNGGLKAGDVPAACKGDNTPHMRTKVEDTPDS